MEGSAPARRQIDSTTSTSRSVLSVSIWAEFDVVGSTRSTRRFFNQFEKQDSKLVRTPGDAYAASRSIGRTPRSLRGLLRTASSCRLGNRSKVLRDRPAPPDAKDRKLPSVRRLFDAGLTAVRSDLLRSRFSYLLLPFYCFRFCGPIAGHPTWAWVVGGLCARNRTRRFMS